jgi:DNA-binding NtrC family response regulator
MRARLKIEWGEGKPLVCDLAREAPTTLGRSRENTVVLQDEHASRFHAKIYFADGRWLIEDCGTLNGTRVEGSRIEGPAALVDGQRISIGDMHLRFQVPSTERRLASVLNGAARPAGGGLGDGPATSGSDEASTSLRADEMETVYGFMASAGGESDPAALIRAALDAVTAQTGATIAGFLSLDKNDPLPKLVLPESAYVDIHLSRELTRKVQSEGRAIWLAAAGDGVQQTESLMPFQDALCVPLLFEGRPLGALHVYRSGRSFTARDLRFCEVVAGFLSTSLARIRDRRSLEAENSRLRAQAPVSENLIGESEPLRQLRQLITRVGPRPSTVLIQGESGAGKELVAQDLHRNSPRRHGPLIVLNCAALAPTLLEAELFGVTKNAYTGATEDRQGLFQQADEGTLFLDEIGEMSADCQAKLLRVIEGKPFRPVGGNKEVRADVRVIAATNRDLGKEVADGKFRQDLYFRLCVLCVRVPPLREHAEDIPALVDYFLSKLGAESGRPVRLTEAALARLVSYSWPGNVRQLRAVLDFSVTMCEGDLVDARDLSLPARLPGDQPGTLLLDEWEEWVIRKALRQTGGNQQDAAQMLGIVRETLLAKRKKYNIDRDGN